MALGMYSFFAMRHQAQPRKNEPKPPKKKQRTAARERTSLQEYHPTCVAVALTIKDSNSPARITVDQEK